MANFRFDLFVFTYQIKDQERRILKAIWLGRGEPVEIEQILPHVYDDKTPEVHDPKKAYAAFKESLHRLRRRIVGSGITVKNVGYGRGYCIAAEGAGA